MIHDFSGSTLDENHIGIMGAGFDAFPRADVSLGKVPTDNAFVNATDGNGLIVQADPGEGVMLLFPSALEERAAMIRCSIRSSAPHAAIYLASIDRGENVFVSTITPNNGAFFLNRWRRLADFFLPPSREFQPLIQIVNTSPTNTLTVYLDNFEIVFIDPHRYYSGQFLDGDEYDPERISVVLGEEPSSTPSPSHSPTIPPTSTPTPIPSPRTTPTPIVTDDGVFVTDSASPSDTANLEGGVDRDPSWERELVVHWKTNSDIYREYHIYVSVNEGSSVYLGRTETQAGLFIWTSNPEKRESFVSLDYGDGPSFNTSISFTIFGVKKENGADCLGQTKPVLIEEDLNASTPTLVSTSTLTPTPTFTPSPSKTYTPSPTKTMTSTRTPTRTFTPTKTPTLPPTPTPTVDESAFVNIRINNYYPNLTSGLNSATIGGVWIGSLNWEPDNPQVPLNVTDWNGDGAFEIEIPAGSKKTVVSFASMTPLRIRLHLSCKESVLAIPEKGDSTMFPQIRLSGDANGQIQTIDLEHSSGVWNIVLVGENILIHSISYIPNPNAPTPTPYTPQPENPTPTPAVNIYKVDDYYPEAQANIDTVWFGNDISIFQPYTQLSNRILYDVEDYDRDNEMELRLLWPEDDGQVKAARVTLRYLSKYTNIELRYKGNLTVRYGFSGIEEHYQSSILEDMYLQLHDDLGMLMIDLVGEEVYIETFQISEQIRFNRNIQSIPVDPNIADSEFPKIVTSNVIDLDKIFYISKFRSGLGHDYSDDFESCRTMKHYYAPLLKYKCNGCVPFYAPFDGYIVDFFGQPNRGLQVVIQPKVNFAYDVRLQHVDMLPGMTIGSEVRSGDLLGYVTVREFNDNELELTENGNELDVCIGVSTTDNKFKRISIFNLMTDDVFQEYIDYGAVNRKDFIIDKETVDRDPYLCDGSDAVYGDHADNWNDPNQIFYIGSN